MGQGIADNANPGIGTSSPGAKLDINGGLKFTGSELGVINATNGNLNLLAEDGMVFRIDENRSASGGEAFYFRNGSNTDLLIIGERGSIYTVGWTDASFGTGWSNYGSGYHNVGYKKVGDLVFLRGLANSGANAWSSYGTIFTLPVGFRPAARLIFGTTCNSNAFCRWDITSSGTVQWDSGGAGSGWVSLEGIVFSVD